MKSNKSDDKMMCKPDPDLVHMTCRGDLMSIDIDQCVFVGDRDQDSVVLNLSNENCRFG